MRAKLSYAVTAAVLVFYFVLVGSRGRHAHPDRHAPDRHLRRGGADPAGASASGSSGRTPSSSATPTRLAAELDAEGGLPVDELRRTPGGRDRPRLGRRGLRQAQGRDGGGPGRLAQLVPPRRRLPRRPRHPARPQGDAARDRPARRQARSGGLTTRSDTRRTVGAGPHRGPAPSRRHGRLSPAGTPRPTPRPRPPPGRTPRYAPGSRRCAWSAAAAASAPPIPPYERSAPAPARCAAAPASAPAAAPSARRRPAPTASCACRGSPPGAARARSPTRPTRSSRSAHGDDGERDAQAHAPAPDTAPVERDDRPPRTARTRRAAAAARPRPPARARAGRGAASGRGRRSGSGDVRRAASNARSAVRKGRGTAGPHSIHARAVPGEAIRPVSRLTTSGARRRQSGWRQRPWDAWTAGLGEWSCQRRHAEDQGADEPGHDGEPDEPAAGYLADADARAGGGVTLLRNLSASATKANGTGSRRRNMGATSPSGTRADRCLLVQTSELPE